MATKKSKSTDENDFRAMDKLARSVTPAKLRPLTPEMRRRWEAAKRGRSAKSPAPKAVPTMIAVEPALLKKLDARARELGMSRSQLVAESLRRHLDSAA